MYLEGKGPEPHSFLQILLGPRAWGLSYLLWMPCCPLSFPAWSRWTQIETGGRGAHGGWTMTLTRETLTMATCLLVPAREGHAAEKLPPASQPASQLGPGFWWEGARILVLEGGEGLGSLREGDAEVAWVTRSVFMSTHPLSLHSRASLRARNPSSSLPQRSPSEQHT